VVSDEKPSSLGADLGYPTLVGYTPTIEIYLALSFPECSGHSPH
jgi:hypothetical protein